ADASKSVESKGVQPVVFTPLDVKNLLLTDESNLTLDMKPSEVVVDVRKPSNEWFIRVHPSDEYSGTLGAFELGDDLDRHLYFTPRNYTEKYTLTPVEAKKYHKILLCTAITREGRLFLWPIKHAKPGKPGKPAPGSKWSESAKKIALLGRKSWVL